MYECNLTGHACVSTHVTRMRKDSEVVAIRSLRLHDYFTDKIYPWVYEYEVHSCHVSEASRPQYIKVVKVSVSSSTALRRDRRHVLSLLIVEYVTVSPPSGRSAVYSSTPGVSYV